MAPTKKEDVPMIVVDPKTKQDYICGQLLGVGGFGACYHLTPVASEERFACKVIPTTNYKQVSEEMEIHKKLDNKYIVKFFSCFVFANHMFFVLELCTNGSLAEMVLRRKTLTEPETRYFILQIVSGCEYLHEHRIIHRDLKLENIFLTEGMEIRIGDFGLSAALKSDDEQRLELWGTPCFMAPEMLAERGYGQQVDVWAVGCMLYTMLVGKPPFDCRRLKDLLKRIKKNQYRVPVGIGISPEARKLIRSLLEADPQKRPEMSDILYDNFITTGYMPSELPKWCLTEKPIFPLLVDRSMLLDIFEGAHVDIVKGNDLAECGDGLLGGRGQLGYPSCDNTTESSEDEGTIRSIDSVRHYKKRSLWKNVRNRMSRWWKKHFPPRSSK